MSTTVRVNTYTHSVAHVTDNMLSSVKRIIILSGLSPEKFASEWADLERGIKVWLISKHLTCVILEIFKPGTSDLVTRWDLDVDYTYSSGDDGDLWADTDAIKFAIRKAGVIPSDCSYRILVSRKPGWPAVDGWTTGSFLTTTGFTRRPIGTTIGATHLGTSTSYWAK